MDYRVVGITVLQCFCNAVQYFCFVMFCFCIDLIGIVSVFFELLHRNIIGFVIL